MKKIIAEDLSKDIAEIQKLLVGVKMDQYAKAYYDKLEFAAMKYGKEGLQSQVAYLISNLEGVLKPDIEKKLQGYADKGVLAAFKKENEKQNLKKDLKKLGIAVYKKDDDYVVFKKDISAALKSIAVKLDGDGKDFSKQEIEDMKEELLEIGFKQAEIDDMDDQDIIGTWQGETGYIEPDV